MVDYQLEVQTRTYHGYIDLISQLGGLKSILSPFISNITPIFVVIFLMKLMKILKQSYANEYFIELKNTFNKTYDELKADS